jgi:hypothetical protein
MHFDRFLVGEADGFVPHDIAEALIITDTTSGLFPSLSSTIQLSVH